MVLDETAKKQLIERLKAGRAKKKAEKEALQPTPKAPKLKPQPKPRKQEYKDLTKVVEEEPLESDDDIVEVVPEPIPEPVKVAVTEPVKVVVPEPKVVIPIAEAVKPQEAIAKPKKDDKERFIKVVFYKEPTKRQLKIIDTIEESSSDEEPTPAKIVKKAVAKIPKTHRPKSPTAEEKRYAYLKQLADEFF
jgi:hypothetical protein